MSKYLRRTVLEHVFLVGGVVRLVGEGHAPGGEKDCATLGVLAVCVHVPREEGWREEIGRMAMSGSRLRRVTGQGSGKGGLTAVVVPAHLGEMRCEGRKVLDRLDRLEEGLERLVAQLVDCVLVHAAATRWDSRRR
jgi:hypothetical protein